MMENKDEKLGCINACTMKKLGAVRYFFILFCKIYVTRKKQILNCNCADV